MKPILIILGILIAGVLLVQLYAMKSQKDIEVYSYTLVKAYDDFEVREYESSLFTSVKLPTNDFKEASSKGFSVLAGYIFGGNDKEQQIAMTSPVSMSLEDSMTMMFMVPKELRRDELPLPNSNEISFKEEPARTIAAITFGGWSDSNKIESYKQKLISALDKEGLSYTDKFFFLGYNAPYEMTNRRNEVIVELD
tara:strand:- start:2462 stop:3046 length:585 start_codon:yes stop_codon:yes gene_type:complete